MANENLEGLRVAFLATDGVEHAELVEPRKALDRAGARTQLVSPNTDKVRSWRHADWGEELRVDVHLDEARPEDFDALVLPGGVLNPDRLRTNPDAVAFVRSFFDADKPVAAICHGAWTIVEAGCAVDRRIASWPSLRTDLRNAGAEWVDQAVVVDGQLITSRRPEDLPVFNQAMLRVFNRAAATAY